VAYGHWPVLDLWGIRRRGLHAFRHTHTSLLFDTGATPKVVQKQLRQADPPAMLGVYARILGEAQREAVEKAASIVFHSVPKVREENECIQ
jgi:integrase